MTIEMLEKLVEILRRIGGHVNAVRIMRKKEDVDYVHSGADEIEVSIHGCRGDNPRYFSWDLPDATEWVETI